MKKKLLLGLGALALMATMVIGGTLAYFTDSDEASNTITMGNIAIDLVEAKDGEVITEGGFEYTDVMPGDTNSKVPTVRLEEDSQNAWVAIKVEVVANEGFEALDFSDVKMNYDLENWTDLGNGLYMYNATLSADASETAPLFTEVTVPGAWTNEYVGAGFSIQLTAYAVQESNLDFAAASAEIIAMAN